MGRVSLLKRPGSFGLSTYRVGVDVACNILHQGGPPVLSRDGLNGVCDTWVSNGKGCMRPGQQPIPYLRGNLGGLRGAFSGHGFPLQSLVDLHVYVPEHGGNTLGGQNDVRTQDRNLFRIVEIGHGIGFDVLRTWAV